MDADDEVRTILGRKRREDGRFLSGLRKARRKLFSVSLDTSRTGLLATCLAAQRGRLGAGTAFLQVNKGTPAAASRPQAAHNRLAA